MVKQHDWLDFNIGKDTTLKARIGWQGLTTSEYRSSGEYYLVTGTDFENGQVGWETCHFVDAWRYEQDRNIQLKNNDVLITKDGTIGKAGFVNSLDLPATLNSGIFVIRPKNSNLDQRFLYYIFTSKIFEDFLNKLTAGSTINHLYQKDFIHFTFKAPKIGEQKSIAQALSDTDDLIVSLEKLIAKKEATKQGTMQQLLTGKKRLVGFSGEWEEKSLEEVVENSGLVRGPFGGALKKEYFVSKGYKVYEQRNAIYKSIEIGSYFINEEKFQELKRFELSEGDLIVSCSGTIGKIYEIPKNSPKGIINQALLKIKLDNKKINTNFFLYIFNSNDFQSKIIDNSHGGAMPNLVGMDTFKKSKILVPNIKEQQAIAKILSDVDNEIEMLKTKLSKTKAIKEAMMSELLTGKTRLIQELK